MLHQLGYDERAFLWQTIVALVVLPLSYLVSNSQENVNWVYEFGQNPQRILPASLFVILLMLLFPLAAYLPTHLLFARIFKAQGRKGDTATPKTTFDIKCCQQEPRMIF